MNEALRYEIFTSAVGYVQANPKANVGTVTQWIRNVGWAGENVHASTALAIATRAIQAVRVAAEMNADTFLIPTLGQIPNAVGIQPDDPRIVYQVLVVAVDASGEEVTTRIDLQLDAPVSALAAQALALEQLPMSGTRGKRQVREALLADPQQEPTVKIVAVGKR